MVRLVAVTDKGVACGESSPHAKYTDHEIEQVFYLRDQGFSYRQIAAAMDMPRSTVHAIVTGKMRGHIPDHWVRK